MLMTKGSGNLLDNPSRCEKLRPDGRQPFPYRDYGRVARDTGGIFRVTERFALPARILSEFQTIRVVIKRDAISQEA